VTWLSAVPDVLVCIGLFLVPGLLATYLGGLRGITAWATAPLVTVAVAAAVAVASGLVGFRFGPWPVAAGVVVMAGLAAGLSWVLRTRRVERPPRDPRPYSLAVVAGVVVAAVVGTVTFIRGVGRPDAISQTWDAVFHYNAIRYIEQTGKASPLTIDALGQPGGHGGFYPDAWHTMATLLAQLTGAPVPVAATVTCLVVAALVWPLSCLLLARHLFGAAGRRATAAAVVTGMLSSLFGPFPWMISSYGVLWPNALGMALAPVGVALGMSITRISDSDTFGARRWFFGAAAAWAIAIAHPNSALSVALICLFPLLVAVGPYLLDQYGRKPLGTSAVLLAIVAVAALGGFVAARLPLVRSVEAYAWPTFQTPRQAVVSAFGNGTDGQPVVWVLVAFLLIGMIACFVWRQRRWLVCAELVVVALYVASAAIGTPAARLFTGLWFDDSHRIAAILPIVAIPLTTTGVLAVGEWLQRIAARALAAARPAVALAVPLAVGAVVAVAAGVQSVPANAQTIGKNYSTVGDQMFTSPAKLRFLRTVARLVPGSALVADNPFGGTALLWALTGIHVLFPQAGQPAHNHDMVYLAHDLVQLDQNPVACDLVRRYGVGYMVIAPDDYQNPWQQRGTPGFYDGVVYPTRDPGFRLIAADGPLRLYKITICQRPSHPAGPVEAASRGSG